MISNVSSDEEVCASIVSCGKKRCSIKLAFIYKLGVNWCFLRRTTTPAPSLLGRENRLVINSSLCKGVSEGVVISLKTDFFSNLYL